MLFATFNTDVIVRYWNMAQWNGFERSVFKFFLNGWFEQLVYLAWLKHSWKVSFETAYVAFIQ